MKRCRQCGNTKPLDKFHRHPSGSQGRHPICAACKNANGRASYARSRESNLRYQYGIGDEDFQRLLIQQDERCALCGTNNPGLKGQWHIDHDRRCCPTPRSCGNCIRGLLCVGCNLQLGMYEKLLVRFGLENLNFYINSRYFNAQALEAT